MLTLWTRLTDTFSLRRKSTISTIYWLKSRTNTLFSCWTWDTIRCTSSTVVSWLTCRAVRLSIFTEVASWTWHWSIAIWTLSACFTNIASLLRGLVGVLPIRAALWCRTSITRASMACRTCLAGCGPKGCKLSRWTDCRWCTIWTLVPLRAYCTCCVAYSTVETFRASSGFWCKILALETFRADDTFCLSCTVAIVTRFTRLWLLTLIRAVKSSRTFLIIRTGKDP